MKSLTGKGKPFHSALDKAAALLKRKVGTGAEFMKELQGLGGIKQAEIDERKLGEVMGMPRMTHDQFMAALAAKPAPAIREKVFKNPSTDEVNAALEKQIRKNIIREYKDEGYTAKQIEEVLPESLEDALNSPFAKQAWMGHYEKLNKNPTHHDKYTLPGGENYREMLIKAPKGGEEFGGVGAHFKGEPGILASMRLKDRVGPNGEKLLHLEELQSDWHQKGREGGYGPQLTPEDAQRVEELQRKSANGGISMGERAEWAGLIKKREGAVPDAPFKKNWEEMALKRLVHHAAENGYHGIVVTPGAEQADRYDLSKHINDLTITRNLDKGLAFNIKATDPSGRIVMDENKTSLKDLDSYVGKELAEKVLDDFSEKPGHQHSYSGLDLQVGGEGMKGFYDKKVPNILNSIGKKYGVKTQLHGHTIKGRGRERTDEEHQRAIQEGGLDYWNMTQQQRSEHDYEPKLIPVHHFPITEDMRKDISTNGLPLYADGGIIRKAEGGNVNPFDYENPEHVHNVATHAVKHKDFKAYEPKLMAEVLSTGNHRHLEDPRIQYAMRQAGHNAYHVQEKTGKKLHKMEPVVKKAMGGTIQPSVNQMRIALNQNKLAIPASDLKNVGANEAPQMDVKSFVNPGGQQDGELPVGGIDQDESKKGMQLMQAQPNLDPSKNQQQGGQPQSAGPSSPLQQPPSNILQMTPQGQAMNAMTPPQQPQAMADGGRCARLRIRG